MFITGQEQTIRNAEAIDSALLCNWWNDGQVMAHAGFPNGLGTDTETIMKQISTDNDDTKRRLILEIGTKPIGEMSYRNLNDGSVEIGIKICEEEYQSKGYGTRFLQMLIDELFSRGYKKIILDTNLKNKRAQHVYEKLGFIKKGIRIDSWTDQLGRLQSAVYYELVKEESHDL
jgi:RimJ/RimL family protein N-acetyltransferase